MPGAFMNGGTGVSDRDGRRPFVAHADRDVLTIVV
jgi:hypothetical protein